MRISICHTTTYSYAQPVGFNPHKLVLRPRGGPDLQVLAHDLRCSPPAEVTWAQDVFGNAIASAQFAERSAKLEITSDLQVEATAEAWPIFPVPPRAQFFPFGYSEDDLVDLGALRAPPEGGSTVRVWAAGFIRSRPTDTLALLKDLNAGVRSAISYRPRDEEGVQSGVETLVLATGSCRDLAALFIDAVRNLGFGARAVSGYLFDAQGAAQQGDTTHAWAEVYLPGAGWIAFDPTHGRVGGGGLIPVAIGRCNAQIMPVVGSYVGSPGDLIDMEVTVTVTTS